MMIFPEAVDVEFTAYCNLKCGFCFGPVDDRTVPNLPTPFWMKVLEWLAEFGAKGIVVSGGEPTIHRDIVALLQHAKSLGLSVVMSTHGQLRERVLECATWTDWIALPVDGVSVDMLRAMRGRLWGVGDASALIDDLRDARPDIRIKLGTVANRQNLQEVPEIGVALIEKQARIDTWKIYQYTARRQFKRRWREYDLPDDQYSSLKNLIRARLPNPPFNVVYSSNASRQRAYVLNYPDGTVAVPNVGERMEDISIGNVYTEGKTVLKRVSGFSDENHRANYHSTYSNSVVAVPATTTGGNRGRT